MLAKSLRNILSFVIVTGLLSLGYFGIKAQTQVTTNKTNIGSNALIPVTEPVFSQPIDPSGKLFLSAWLDPDGSDFDQKVWDDFTLPADQAITDIEWYGGYDPLKNGMGGPADFTVAIYPSIAAGTEPAVAGAPLVEYQYIGNAGETLMGTVGSIPMYFYTFNLPTPFNASAGVKYWIHIVASQGGSAPDWGFAAGTGGNGNHYRWGAGAGGDSGYRSVPGDLAFNLLGPVLATETPTDVATDTPTYTATPTATNTPTDTATPTATDTPIPPTATYTATNTATDTPIPPSATYTATSTATDTPVPPTATYTATSTATDTPVPPTATYTATSTATDTPVPPTATFTATNTATDLPTNTATPTATATATNTPTSTATATATNTPTSVPTPFPNTPGKVTGGGNMDVPAGKATFGFVVKVSAGDLAPAGNLTFNDHGANISLKATSFTLLHIEGSYALITGSATVNGQTNVGFIMIVSDAGEPGSSDLFAILIPELNGYYASGLISGGNIQISTP